MPTQNNMEIQDHLGNVFNPKTVSSQVKMEGNRDLSNYDVSTTQKGFMSAEDKVRLDKIYEQTNELYQDINSNQATETVTDSVAGTIQDIEILGNTYQNPSNLAEIKSVGKLRDDGLYEVNVKSCGKNIFNEELFINALKQKNSSKVSIVTEEGKRCVKIIEAHLFKGFVLPFHFDKNKQYTFTFTNKHITQASFVIVVNYEDGTHSTFDTIKLGSFNKQTHISKPNSVIRSVEITFAQGGGTTFIDLDSFQIEENNVATPFEPYKETVATIKLPCQLEGIGDIKDRFYFDKQQGKWFIEKKIGTTILTESNSWQYMSGFDSTNHMGFFLTKMPNMEIQPVFSDKFKNSSNINLDEELVAMTTPGGNKRLFLKIAKTKLTTQDVNGLKNWLKTNNVLVKYIISPSAYQLIELPLDTQIILNSFDGITHIELDGREIQGTIKCKVSKSLKSSVNSLVEKTDSLDNRVKQIEGLKESQSLAYQSSKGSLGCTDTKNGVIEDLKISGRTLVNSLTLRSTSTQYGANCTSEGNGVYKITFNNSTTQWAGGKILVSNEKLSAGKTYTLVINVLENTADKGVDFSHKFLYRQSGMNTQKAVGFRGIELKSFTPTLDEVKNANQLAIYCWETNCTGYVKVQYMILEGDYTKTPELIPEYFEGIKNVGQDVGFGINKLKGSTYETYGNYTDIISQSEDRVVLKWKSSYNSTILTLAKQGFTPKGIGTIQGYIRVGGNIPVENYIHTESSLENFYDNKTGFFKITMNYEGKNNWLIHRYTKRPSGNTDTVELFNLKFEYGSINTPLDFENRGTINIVSNNNPLKQQIKPLFYYDTNGDIVTIPELREWDTIEKHSDGKYYYHKVSGETTLTGDENWTVGLTGTPNFYYELPVTLTSKTSGDKVICNTLPHSGIGSSTTAMGISTTQNGRLRIRLNSEIPLADFKQWLKTNSTTVVFKAPQEEVYECVDLTLSSYEGMTNIQTISGAIKPSIEFKISSHINNVVLSNRDRINNIEKDFVDYVASQSAITLETRYMLDNMLPNNIDDYEESIDYNIYGLLKKNIENDNVFIKKEKLMEILDFYLNVKKITQEMYDELLGELTKDMIQTLETN